MKLTSWIRCCFVPAGSPPHKPGIRVAPVLHRYVMTVLATAGHPAFSVSPIEMNRSGPSYSYIALLLAGGGALRVLSFGSIR